jgi:hypothetical protein
MIGKIKTLFTSYPFFLFSLPLFFIFNGYNQLFGFLSAGLVFRNWLIVQASLLLVFYFSKLALKKTEPAAIYTVLAAIPVLSFGYIHDSIKSLELPSFFSKYIFILPVFVILFTVLYIIIRKRKKTFTESFLFLNTLFLILIVSEIPNSVKRYTLHQSVHNLIDFRFEAFEQYRQRKQKTIESKPDIYFLVFDAMASSKSLSSQLNLDNSSLDTFLTKQGFYVAPNAAANYNFTIHSISTTFNMDYLPEWMTPVMNDPKAYFWGSASMLDNSLFRILRSEDYLIKSYQPISFDNPDWPKDGYFGALKYRHYYYKTLPGRIWLDLFWNYSRIDLGFIRKKQLDVLDKRIAEKKHSLDTTLHLVKSSCVLASQPKFVYGHFMIPHESYYFNEDGSLRTSGELTSTQPKSSQEGYKKQVQYAGTVIKELVTFIQKNNRPNTIIIVAGDHGYRTEDGVLKGYSFSNLNAIYFPDRNYPTLYDSLSPVNTFRIVLNKYFHTNFRLLDDRRIKVTNQTETLKSTKK